MKTIDQLKYTDSKEIGNKKINVKIALTYIDINGYAYFSITGDLNEKQRNGRYTNVSSGCIHEEIIKYFPEYKIFIEVHCLNSYGMHSSFIEDSIYLLKEGDIDKAKRYMQTGEEQISILSKYYKDKDTFLYMCYKLGIIDNFRTKAQKAISKLEELTGKKFENHDKEHKYDFPKLDDEKIKEIELKISQGNFNKSYEELLKDDYAEKCHKALKREEECYKKQIKEINDRYKVITYILKCGILVDNVIYYSHSNKCIFNYSDSYNKIKFEDYSNFMDKIDYSQLPDNIDFEYKD